MNEGQPPSALGKGIEVIKDVPRPVDPNAAALEAAERLSDQYTALKVAYLQEDIKDRRQDRDERLKYAGRIFRLLTGWLIVVGLLVIVQGFGRLWRWSFSLTDPVMLAILGGTTASVIGIFLIVANYLFPKAPRPKVSTDTK